MQKTILYVDDNPDDVLLLRRAVERLGSGLQLAATNNPLNLKGWLQGTEEFQNREEYPSPDVLVLNLRMPGVDGLDLLRWVREQPKYQQLPVFMYTDCINPHYEREALKLGARAYIEKEGCCVELLNQVMQLN